RSGLPGEPSARRRTSNLPSTMKGPNTPLRPDTLDELLSADIDGELERAAADLGLTLDDARTATAAPDAVARRAALVRARDLVAPGGRLARADTDGLAAAALDGARAENELAAARRRRNRFDAGRRIAIAAASIVVIFGAIAVLARGTTTSSNSKSANSSSAPTTVEFGAPEAGPASSALGDVSSADALRAKVLQRLPARVHVPAAKSAGAPAYGNGSSKGGAFDAAGGVKSRQLALAALIGPRGPRGV